MSQDYEANFWQEVRQRKSKKNKKTIQKVLLPILGLVAAGIIYSLHQGLDLIFLLLYLVGLILIGTLISIRYQHLSKKQIVGIIILLLVLGLQANPSALNSIVTKLINNPQPHQIASPWPWKTDNTIHPAVANMPPDAEESISSVAEYIAQEENDPWMRVKAIHDYVISRVDYDIDVLKDAGSPGSRPSQEPQTVFQTHKGVCEGYSRLFTALGKAMGLNAVYVTGNVRREFAPTEVIPSHLRFTTSDYDWTLHAWNAVKINNQWYLVDTTWDDSNEDNFSYRADYLLLPPQVMIISHLPDQQSWQLLSNPINKTKFEDTPILNPRFFSEGLRLDSPVKYETTVQETANIKLTVPNSYREQVKVGFTKFKDNKLSFLDLVGLSKKGEEEDLSLQWCPIDTTEEQVKVACKFSSSGIYEAFMFLARKSVGQLKFKAVM